MTPDPLRQVVTWRFSQSRYSRPGSWTNFLELSCGHGKAQKSSIAIPARARCRECARAPE